RTGSGRPGAPITGASPRATTRVCTPPSALSPGRERSEAALHLLEVRQCLVEVLEERLQNIGAGWLGARNTILEEAGDARLVLQQRVLAAQPAGDAFFAEQPG